MELVTVVVVVVSFQNILVDKLGPSLGEIMSFNQTPESKMAADSFQ